jgi:CubicO group peptidase (beta-lactamase class C family)
MRAMRIHLISAAVVAALAACGSSKPQPAGPAAGAGSDPAVIVPVDGAQAAPHVETLAADTPRTTASGVTYTVPAGWTVTTTSAYVKLTAQEGDLHIVVVEPPRAADADAAVTAAWRAYGKSAPPLTVANDGLADDGWDQIRSYAYETNPNEKRAVAASALRKDTTWTVVILEAAMATAEKRSSQIGLFGGSLRPAGAERESFAGKPAAALDAARLAKLDEAVELGIRELGIPGVAVAIVQDGKVVLSKGYGVREVGKKPAVDPRTLFMIGSNTKALTTLLLATLVDAGKVTWDQKVTTVYPAFKLGDDATTASVEIKHLICACTGLPRKDLDWIFEFAKATPASIMGYLATVQPTTKFGETFQYSNLLAAAAGYVAAYVAAPKTELGKGYDAAMKARIFAPLGMKATTFDYKKALAGNHAMPASWDVDGATVSVPMAINYSVVPVRPAGAAWSNVDDMIKYVQLELAKGTTPAGKRIVSEAALLERRKPNVSLGETSSYGMGLMTSGQYGIPVIHHGGRTFGFTSDMFWLPDHGVGGVILTNSDYGTIVTGAVQRVVLEQVFDAKPEALDGIRTAAKAAKEQTVAERKQLTIPADPAATAELAAAYANPELGSLKVVRAKDGTVRFDLGEWQSPLASRKNTDGTVSFVTTVPGLVGLPLVAGKAADGKRTLTVRDAQHEYVFTETATK